LLSHLGLAQSLISNYTLAPFCLHLNIPYQHQALRSSIDITQGNTQQALFLYSQMAPILPKKRKSPEPNFNDHTQRDGHDVPLDSPPRKKPRITQSQKQALIDNLQLESMQFTYSYPHRYPYGLTTITSNRTGA